MQPHRSLWVKFGDVNDNADAKKHHVEFCKRGRPGAWWRLVGRTPERKSMIGLRQ